MDCAFPPFPTTPKRDRKTNPTSPRPPMSTPRSPRPAEPNSEGSSGTHSRGMSSDSKGTFRTSVASSRYGESISRPSTSHSLRRPSVGGPRPRNVMDEVPPIPTGPLKSFRRDSQMSAAGSTVAGSPPKPAKGGYGGLDMELTEDPESYEDASVGSGNSNSNSSALPRSKTMPARSETQDELENPPDPPARRPTEPVSAVMRDSLFLDVPSTSVPSTTNTEDKKDDEGPLTVSNFARALGLDNPYHAAEESTSSTESSHSDNGSGSSLSSPPSVTDRKPSELSQIDEMLQDLQMNQNPSSPSNEKPPATRTSDLEPPRLTDPSLRGPDSPTDPALERGLFSERSAPPKSPLRPKTPVAEPIPRPPTATGQKRRCRGCGQPITGKSVSSADGRLTGRYHKACFVCHTCRAPFLTADFYVLDDQPYCAQHYHELNGSLCATCNRGIEGQYLETVEKSGGRGAKFHPDCLTCRTCKIVLRGDYFEWNGQVYCERDARRAAAMTPPAPPPPGARRRPTMPSSPLARPPGGYPPGPPPPGRGPRHGPPGPYGPGGPPPSRGGPGPGPGGPRGPPANNNHPGLGINPNPGPGGQSPGPRRFPERRTTKLMMI